MPRQIIRVRTPAWEGFYREGQKDFQERTPGQQVKFDWDHSMRQQQPQKSQSGQIQKGQVQKD